MPELKLRIIAVPIIAADLFWIRSRYEEKNIKPPRKFEKLDYHLIKAI